MAKNNGLCWNDLRFILVLNIFETWQVVGHGEYYAIGEVARFALPSAAGLSLIMLEVKMNHLWASVDTWVGLLCKLVFCWRNMCDSLLVLNINVTERKLGWFTEEISQTLQCILLRSRYLHQYCASDTSTCRRKMEGECLETLLSLDSVLKAEIIKWSGVGTKKPCTYCCVE